MGLNYLTDSLEHENQGESISSHFGNKRESYKATSFSDSSYSGIAKIVTDKDLNQKISQLKYPGEKRAEEKRVAIEITLHEQL